jgi:hypothetical protein
MFTKKKKETSTTETVKALGATQIRYEAEMKKAELLRKYMKKAPVEEPDWDDEEQEGAEQSVYYPPAEPDYLGLNARAVGNVRFAEPDTQDGEDLGWEVDESAYQTEEFALTGLEYQQRAEQPVFGPQPGAVWTANYKYQDVRDILGINCFFCQDSNFNPVFRTLRLSLWASFNRIDIFSFLRSPLNDYLTNFIGAFIRNGSFLS